MTLSHALISTDTRKQDSEHRRAAYRGLRGDSNKLKVAFNSPKYGIWEASHLTFASSDHLRGVDCKDRIPLLLTRPAKHHLGHEFCPVSYPDYKSTDSKSKRNAMLLRCYSNLHNEELRVSAINRLSDLKVTPSIMQEDPHVFSKQAIFNELLIGKGLWSLQNEGINVQIPSFDLFDGIPSEIREACLGHVFEDDRKRVEQYFGKLQLGLGLVSGPPGTGKSHLASIIALLMCHNKSIKHVYVTAASHGATDNILERINNMAQAVNDKLHDTDHQHLMFLRGYSLSTETDNCTNTLLGKPFKEDTIGNSSPWQFDRSLCWWTLRALGSKGVPPLTVDDNAELLKVHQKLNMLVNTCSTTSELSQFRQLVQLAQGIVPATEYQSILTQPTHRKIMFQLMELVVGCANIVATTPITSTSWIYRSFNDRKARAVVFDEAATMFCSDGLLVYGNTPRPMVAIGDPKQLSPNLATAFETLYANRKDSIPVNRFAEFSQLSWLSWFIHLGWPVFHLYTQHRMVKGLFDLSLYTVYRSLTLHFRYSPLCHPDNFNMGLEIEEYLKVEHSVRPSERNTLQPVFFNCADCPCRKSEESRSRFNPRQADLIATFLAKMMEKLQLPPEDIVVLTPFRENVWEIGRRFRKVKGLRNVVCTTFNRFQGCEAQVVILALCVDQKTGPLSVANQRSLNVALTRQRSSLLIFGDIHTTIRMRHYDESDDEDTTTRNNYKMIRDVFLMIRRSQRIVNLRGDKKVDPDSLWET